MLHAGNLHSDQGSQFASKNFTAYCKSQGILQSMSRAGCPYDNAPMESFFSGYRTSVLDESEMILAVVLPLAKVPPFQAFFKRGSRASLTLSRISVACAASLDGEKIESIRIAAGSMSPFPVRLTETEAFLLGQEISAGLAARGGELASLEISPRKSAPFRRAVTGNYVRRFLLSLGE